MKSYQADAKMKGFKAKSKQQWDDPTPHELIQADGKVVKFSKKLRRRHNDSKIGVSQVQ